MRVRMESYDASKNRLQDLKNFPTFKTVTTTILQKILQKQFLRCSIDWKELSINWKLFLIDRTWIKHQSSQAEASDQFSWSIWSIDQKLWPIEHPETWIFTKKISDLVIPFYSFYKWILFNLISVLQYILVYTYIYNSMGPLIFYFTRLSLNIVISLENTKNLFHVFNLE